MRIDRAARAVVFLAVAASCATAFAAGVREDAIGIQFPDRLGEFTLKGRTQFPQPGAGASIAYQQDDVRGAVYVYNEGLASIPTGVGSPVIQKHFQQTVTALQRAAAESAGKVTSAKASTISAFPGCGPQFVWRADQITLDGKAVVSRTYLTGLNNHFVKLRVTHFPASAPQADQFVQQIRRVLGNCR